jgi:hypothetical protein
MARRRVFTPLRHAPPAISQALTPAAPGDAGTWSSDPAAHIAAYRPACGVAGCREPGMTWSRCACGEVFSRCHAHESINPMAAARAAHPCKATHHG